jgi:hypothetical protein
VSETVTVPIEGPTAGFTGAIASGNLLRALLAAKLDMHNSTRLLASFTVTMSNVFGDGDGTRTELGDVELWVITSSLVVTNDSPLSPFKAMIQSRSDKLEQRGLIKGAPIEGTMKFGCRL